MTPDLPLLLLPGTLCDRGLWQGVPLRGRVYGPDALRGPTLARAAELALLGAPDQVHLVGFSLGAILACEVLRRHSGRVARLTLIAFNPHAPTGAQLSAWETQERRVQAGEFAEVTAALAPDGPPRQDILEMAARVGPAAFRDQLSLLRSRPDSRPDLIRYPGPLTLLVGGDDAITPPALADELRQLRPATRMQVVPGAGHFLPLEAPQVVAEVLNARLETMHA